MNSAERPEGVPEGYVELPSDSRIRFTSIDKATEYIVAVQKSGYSSCNPKEFGAVFPGESSYPDAQYELVEFLRPAYYGQGVIRR